MPTGYMLNWSDNTLKPPFLLPEATVDNHTTSLQLTGKRVINWGEFLNENMLHLLEHGFSKTAPNNPTIGQLWLDANNGDLKIFTSQSTWNVIKTVPGIGTQTTTTTTPVPTTTTTTTTTTPFPTTSTTTTSTTTPFPTTSTTTTTTTTSTTPKPAGNFIWRRPLNGNSAVEDGQFFNGDTYTLYVPVNNADYSKGEIYAGLPGYDGVESIRLYSGNFPPGINPGNGPIVTGKQIGRAHV